jgi:hypothetical protein
VRHRRNIKRRSPDEPGSGARTGRGGEECLAIDSGRSREGVHAGPPLISDALTSKASIARATHVGSTPVFLGRAA